MKIFEFGCDLFVRFDWFILYNFFILLLIRKAHRRLPNPKSERFWTTSIETYLFGKPQPQNVLHNRSLACQLWTSHARRLLTRISWCKTSLLISDVSLKEGTRVWATRTFQNVQSLLSTYVSCWFRPGVLATSTLDSDSWFLGFQLSKFLSNGSDSSIFVFVPILFRFFSSSCLRGLNWAMVLTHNSWTKIKCALSL